MSDCLLHPLQQQYLPAHCPCEIATSEAKVWKSFYSREIAFDAPSPIANSGIVFLPLPLESRFTLLRFYNSQGVRGATLKNLL